MSSDDEYTDEYTDYSSDDDELERRIVELETRLQNTRMDVAKTLYQLDKTQHEKDLLLVIAINSVSDFGIEIR
jgi:hypothetical protein